MPDNEYKISIGAELDEASLKALKDRINNEKVNIKIDNTGTKGAENNVKAVGNALKSASGHANTFGSAIKRALGFGSAATVAVQSIRAIRKAAKEAVESIKEIDEAITNLRIVTNENYDTVSKWMKNYNEMAKTLGSTTTQIADSATTWMRQGKTTAETNTLIKDSVMLAKNGMIEEAEAADYLTTSMKGYKVSVDDTIGIVDKLSKLDSEAAVTAGDLAKGMSNIAQMANDVGVSMDTLLGQLAATGEVVGDVDKVGTALKTIYSRMGDIQAGKLELIDSDGTTELLSNTEITLKNVGIDLRSTVTEFNSYEDVLSNLAYKWDSLGSVQQAALSKALAGTRQQNIFRTLMANYDKVRKYTESAANSAGTAEQKFNNYLDSIEAKTNILKASFESLALNTISGNSVKGVIEATSAIVVFLDKTNILKGALAGFATYGALKGFEILTRGIKSAYINLNEFNSALKFLKAGNIGEAQLQVLATMTSNLSKSQLKAVLSSEVLNNEQRIAILTAQGMSTAEAEAALSTMGFATSEGVATGATATFTGVLKGLWATLKANPFILIAGAIATAVIAVSACENRAKNMAEKLKDSADEVSEIQSEVTDLNDELSATNKRIDELLRKDKLTIVEQAELDRLRKANSELKRTIALKEAELKISKGKNETNFVNSVNALVYDDIQTMGTGATTNGDYMFNAMLNTYRNSTDEDAKRQAKEWLDNFVPKFNEYLNNLVGYDYNSLSEDTKAAYDKVMDIQNAYLVATKDNFDTVFSQIYNSDRFAEGREALENATKNDLTLTEVKDLYSNNNNVRAMIDNMKSVGLINKITANTFSGLAEQITIADQAVGTIAKNEKVAFSDFIANEYTQETINGFKNDLTDLAQALENFRNGDLSNEDLFELYEKFPELASHSDDLGTALSELLTITQQEVNNQFEEWETNMPTDEDTTKLHNIRDQLNEIGNAKADSGIEKLKSALNDLRSTYDNIQKVIDEYNENGYLSMENLESIMDLEPEYINLLIDENGQINLNNQAYKDYVISKAKSLLVNQLTSLYDSILAMNEEEAQAYANAKAFNEETRSVKDLLTATTELYIIKAKAKDYENGNTTYVDALTRSFGTAANYASIVESYINSLSTTQNEFSTSVSDTTSALESEKKALEEYQNELEDAQSSLNDLISVVQDYIKQMKNDEKEALEEQIDTLEKQKDTLDESKDKYAEIIDKKKEALKLAKEEKEAADELADKQNSVAKDRLALEVAGLDDSSAGKKAQKQTRDNLNKSEKNLSDYLYDEAYDKQVAELDDLQEKYEESIEKRKALIDSQVEHIESKIDEIDDYLGNSRQIYEDACVMIDNDNGELYGKLWDYTYRYTTKTKAEFDNLWSNAQVAIQKYKGDNDTLLSVMEVLQGEIYTTKTNIDEMGKVIDSTSGAIDNVSSSLGGLGTAIDDYMAKLQAAVEVSNNLGNNGNGDKTAFWVQYKGRKYQTGYNYNGDTTNNRLLAASELTKLIAKDYSGFDQYGLGIVQGLLGVGNKKAWHVTINGHTLTSYKKNKDEAKNELINEAVNKGWITSYREGSSIEPRMKYYAKGTRNSSGGISVTQENGLEAIFGKLSKGKYTMMPEGSQVFDSERTDNLYEFSGNPEEFISKLADRGLSMLSADELRDIGYVSNSLDRYNMPNPIFEGGDLTKSIIKNITNNNGSSIYNNDN